MNERIKELYTQICMEQNLPFTVEHNSAVMLDAFADKFAELIVRECVEHCEGQLVHKKTAEHMGLTYNDGVMDCAAGLKEHFGVE